VVELQREWAAVGIPIHILACPNGQHSHTSQYTPFLLNEWISDYADPQDYVGYLFSAGSAYNVGNYANATYQRLVAEGDRQPSGLERNAAYEAAQRLIIADAASFSGCRWARTCSGRRTCTGSRSRHSGNRRPCTATGPT